VNNATHIILAGMLAIACRGQSPTFDGQSIAYWATRVETEPDATMQILVAAQERSVGVLSALVDEGNARVSDCAVLACERIGRAALPAAPSLIRQLQTAPSWWRRMLCARALVAVGARSPEVTATLLEQMRTGASSRLVYECTAALLGVEADATRKTLEMLESSDVRHGRSVDILYWLGDPVVGDLIVMAPRSDRMGDLARSALPRFGWQVVTRLEHAGQFDLAQVALRTGPLQGIEFAESKTIDYAETQAAVHDMPKVVAEWADGHGQGVEVIEAHAGPDGLLVDRLYTVPVGLEGIAMAAASATVARGRTLDATRQLVALPRMKLRSRDEEGSSLTRSVALSSTYVRVRVELAGSVLMDCAFCGYPATDNIQDRFCAQAARRILSELMTGVVWKDRPTTDGDHDAMAARGLRENQASWVTERLQAMARKRVAR
jgi:hypothetical protein